jgi:hypothetical protein
MAPSIICNPGQGLILWRQGKNLLLAEYSDLFHIILSFGIFIKNIY